MLQSNLPSAYRDLLRTSYAIRRVETFIRKLDSKNTYSLRSLFPYKKEEA
jgi:hypothetical protein